MAIVWLIANEKNRSMINAAERGETPSMKDFGEDAAFG